MCEILSFSPQACSSEEAMVSAAPPHLVFDAAHFFASATVTICWLRIFAASSSMRVQGSGEAFSGTPATYLNFAVFWRMYAPRP